MQFLCPPPPKLLHPRFHAIARSRVRSSAWHNAVTCSLFIHLLRLLDRFCFRKAPRCTSVQLFLIRHAPRDFCFHETKTLVSASAFARTPFARSWAVVSAGDSMLAFNNFVARNLPNRCGDRRINIGQLLMLSSSRSASVASTSSRRYSNTDSFGTGEKEAASSNQG